MKPSDFDSQTAKVSNLGDGLSPAALRHLFAAQARLLAERAQRGLSIGDASLENLFRTYENLAVEELIS